MTIARTEAGEVVETLTDDETARLRVKEHAIERGADEVAKALTVIRDERLYRAEFPTFEEYCRERWGMTHRHVNRQIIAAEVAEALGPIGPAIPESQARELADLRDNPDELRETYQKAHEATDGNVTAAAIRAIRNPEPEPTMLAANETVNVETGEIVTRTPAPAISYPAPPAKPKRALRPVDESEWNDQDRAEELARNLSRNLSLLYAVTSADRRAEYIATWVAGTRELRPLGAEFITPKHMRDLSAALIDFATEWENAHV